MRPIVIDKKDRLNTGAKSPASKPKRSSRQIKKSVTDMMSSFLRLNLKAPKKVSKPATKKIKSSHSSRRKPTPLWLKPTAVLFAVGFVISPFGYFGYLAIEYDLVGKSQLWASDVFDNNVSKLGLTVQEINVQGRERTTRQDLMKALDIARGDNILRFDPELAKERIETLGWVETVMVKKNLPDQVFVRVTERRPFVRWQQNGENYLVDRKGSVVSSSVKDQVEFSYLPKVVGAGANIEAAALFDLMSTTPKLFTRIQNAVRIRDRRWDVEFENGVKVLLPEKDVQAAWRKLNEMQEDNNVLSKDIVAIDIRSANKVYVRLSPNAAVIRRGSEKET